MQSNGINSKCSTATVNSQMTRTVLSEIHEDDDNDDDDNKQD